MGILDGFGNSKKQGDAGLGVAIGFFSLNKYTVAIPLSDSQDYDLIVEKDSILNRVQIKTTKAIRNNSYVCHLRVCGGNRSGIGKSKYFDATKCEFLFVLCDNGDRYLIPSTLIHNMTTLNMNKYLSFRVV